MKSPQLAATLMAVVVALALAPLGSASAQEFSVERWTVAGGGDVYTDSADGEWTLSGTAGQWDASAPQRGGNWTLTGGFWAGSAVAGENATIFRDGFEAG